MTDHSNVSLKDLLASQKNGWEQLATHFESMIPESCQRLAVMFGWIKASCVTTPWLLPLFLQEVATKTADGRYVQVDYFWDNLREIGNDYTFNDLERDLNAIVASWPNIRMTHNNGTCPMAVRFYAE